MEGGLTGGVGTFSQQWGAFQEAPEITGGTQQIPFRALHNTYDNNRNHVYGLRASKAPILKS